MNDVFKIMIQNASRESLVELSMYLENENKNLKEKLDKAQELIEEMKKNNE